MTDTPQHEALPLERLKTEAERWAAAVGGPMPIAAEAANGLRDIVQRAYDLARAQSETGASKSFMLGETERLEHIPRSGDRERLSDEDAGKWLAAYIGVETQRQEELCVAAAEYLRGQFTPSSNALEIVTTELRSIERYLDKAGVPRVTPQQAASDRVYGLTLTHKRLKLPDEDRLNIMSIISWLRGEERGHLPDPKRGAAATSLENLLACTQPEEGKGSR